MLKKTLESPLDCKEIKPVNSKGNQPWIFIGSTNGEAEAPILGPPDAKSRLFRKDWCWERLKAGGEGNNRGWDGWMASLTQWTWVWANSGSWWWTGRPGVLQSMGSQRVTHDWVVEQQLMFWHTWPRGLEVEPESCSSWRLMSPVAAFEPFWFPFLQWGVSLLPRTAMLSGATREQLLRDQPRPAEPRHWRSKSRSRSVLWGAVVSWGVSAEWKKSPLCLRSRKRGPHEGQHPRPSLSPLHSRPRSTVVYWEQCRLRAGPLYHVVSCSLMATDLSWSSCPFSVHIPPWGVEGGTLSASWETWIMIPFLPTALWPWATF